MKEEKPIHMKERHDEIRQNNPDRYFGSDLNQFIYEECGKKMVVNNIDLIMWKYRQNKNHLLRVIESKHTLEKPMNAGQKKVLRTLRQVFIIANRFINGIDFELFIVKGDQPYNEIEAYDMINHKSIMITGKANVVAWLEMN